MQAGIGIEILSIIQSGAWGKDVICFITNNISEKLVQHCALCRYTLLKFGQHFSKQTKNKHEEEKELIFAMCQKIDIGARLFLMTGFLTPIFQMGNRLEMSQMPSMSQAVLESSIHSAMELLSRYYR